MPKALVIGAGPAGMLAAVQLKRSGFETDLADPSPGSGLRTRPQSGHVHLLQPATLALITRWLPQLSAHTNPQLCRTTFDQLLWTLSLQYIDSVHTARIKSVIFRGNKVLVHAAGQIKEYNLLIDASGAARATAGSVARQCNTALPLDSGPASGDYATLKLTNLSEETRQIIAVRDNDSGYGALLQHTGNGRGLLTLQAPVEERPPEDLTTALRVLRGFADPRPWAACHKSRALGRTVIFRGRPATRLALEQVTDLPANWLPMGDCLLTTQPYLGQGFEQLTEHVVLLEQGLAEGRSCRQIRNQLVHRARQRWWNATWRDAMQACALS